MSVRAKRGTRAKVDEAAGNGLLKEGELIYLTDEKKFAGATGTNEYAELVKQGPRRVENFTSNYTVTDADNGAIKRFQTANASARTITVPPDLPLGTQIEFYVTGSGSQTFTPATGGPTVLIASKDGLRTITGAGSHATLTCVAVNPGVSTSWFLHGTLS